MNKTVILSAVILGLSSIAHAAPADKDAVPYNLSTEPASTAWQATPIVGASGDQAAAVAEPTHKSGVRPIAGYSGKSKGRGKNVGGEAIITLNNDTPTGDTQLYGEIKGGVSGTRTKVR